ncbi:MAG: hypothetical protein A2166_02510 [Omnitrophica WOR_2 bacterium RBG_13_41_10]|nr:MAG: hypothetical protein A2166_02510 [Omnitrophica WOR_2 bacterium RBG_13_41_10]
MNHNIYISVVIPAYNENVRIVKTLEKTLDYFEIHNYLYEIIIIDDASTDVTYNLVDSLSRGHSNIKILRNRKNMGKGFSVKRGVLESRGDYVLFSDADLSTPIEEIEKFFPHFNKGYDIVIGSRALKDSQILLKQPWYRKNMGKIFNLLVRLFIIKGIKDTQCGFKCFRKEVAHKIFSLQRLNGFCFDVEILYIAKSLGYKIKEVPIIWLNCLQSRVAIFNDSICMFFDLFKIKFNNLRKFYDVA